jgi:hypothetical protein
LQYSFLGYHAKFKTVQTVWEEDKLIITQQNLAVIKVKLGYVAVTLDRISIKMAGDLQYNAKVFKVAKDSGVEELLSRIP